MKPIYNFKSFEKRKISDFFEMESDERFCEKALEQEGLYKSPPGYLSWDTQLKICFCAGSTRTTLVCYEHRDSIGVSLATVSRAAVVNSAPARFITKELCEAFMATPTPVLTKEILEVLPYIHIMLPRNFVYDHEGDAVVSLVVKTGTLIKQKMSDEDENTSRELLKYMYSRNLDVPDEIRGAKGIWIATVTESGNSVITEFIDENAKSWHEEMVKTIAKDYGDDEIEKLEKIKRIAINSLLIHLYEPELITTDRVPPTKGLGFSNKGKQPLPPTWIGKTFKYQREKQESSGSGSAGSAREQIRSHWRRGHWHTVVCGKGRHDRRVQWFKPVYVTGESKK